MQSGRCAASTGSSRDSRAEACSGAARAAGPGRWARRLSSRWSRRAHGSPCGATCAASRFRISRSASTCPGAISSCTSVWYEGRLLRAQATEVLGYFAAGNNPSGIFSLSCLAKTVVADEALQDRARRGARARAATNRYLRRGIERDGGRRAGDNGDKRGTFSGRHYGAAGDGKGQYGRSSSPPPPSAGRSRPPSR